jgi:hypothetical protein
MDHSPAHWSKPTTLLAISALALSAMVGCQGFSSGKPSSQISQPAASGELTAAPASLNFGNVQVGTSQSLTETLSNAGSSSLTISQAVVSGAGFSISGLTSPVTLAAGQSTTVSVIFAPASSGSATGALSLTNDGSNSLLNIALSANAVAAGTQGTLTVNPVDVGNVVVGASGTVNGTLSATVANVSVSSISLSGTNPSEFSIGGLAFPVLVTTSQPVSFTVTFTPGASGAASAVALFASNGLNSPSAANLSGTGTAAPAHTVSLSWTGSTTSGVTSYNIYRALYSTKSCGSYSNVGSTPGSITTYSDSEVVDGTTYCYATTAVDPNGESGYSNITKAVIPAP